MISTLNPLAAEFIPGQVYAKIQDQDSQEVQVNQESQDQVKDKFYEANQVISKFKALRALEKQVKMIPKITNYDGLQQVAQITYHHPVRDQCYELFWNGKHAILDCPSKTRSDSWQYPDMTIRQIIGHYVDENILITATADGTTEGADGTEWADALASSAPAIQLHVTPVYDDENTWHRWKSIP